MSGYRPHAVISPGRPGHPTPPHRSFPAACRLIDGANITMEDEHMWLIPFSPGLDHVVTIRFDRAESIAGLRFWNYNKSPEDTYRGVSQGTVATLGPLSGKRCLDEWLAWLPERSINPPEPSKWSWGLQAGRECAAVSSSANSRWRLKSPGRLRKLQYLVFSGGSEICSRPGPYLSVACCTPVFTERFLGPGLSLDPRPSLWEASVITRSLRVSKSEVQKSPVAHAGSHS